MLTRAHGTVAHRRLWRSVMVPSEHGGWGLTLEPVLLGLLVAPSFAGVLLGFAAFVAFLVRTPLKLVVVDRRRGRRLARSRLALLIAALEMVLLVALGVGALALAGATWLVPVVAAVPLVATEWWFDVRSRSRRLVPELAGAIGISAAAAAIAIAGDSGAGRAAGVWAILAARVIGSIPFVRTEIIRFRHGLASTTSSDVAQLVAMGVVLAAVALDRHLALGALALGAVLAAQFWWVRRPPVPPKRLGIAQMALGILVVVTTAIGVHL